MLEEPDLPDEEKTTLLNFLLDHHHVFCLEEGARGKTDLVQMKIDAWLRRQPAEKGTTTGGQTTGRDAIEWSDRALKVPRPAQLFW